MSLDVKELNDTALSCYRESVMNKALAELAVIDAEIKQREQLRRESMIREMRFRNYLRSGK